MTAEGCLVNAPGYQDSRKGKSGVQTCRTITHLCCAWCRCSTAPSCPARQHELPFSGQRLGIWEIARCRGEGHTAQLALIPEQPCPVCFLAAFAAWRRLADRASFLHLQEPNL